ncbi:MAG: rod shape-determining protein MreC [Nitrospirota bacterium]
MGIAFLLILFSPQIQRRPLLIIEQPLLLVESWLQRLLGGATGWGGGLMDRYVTVWGLSEENQQLRDELSRLRGELTLLEERLGEVARQERLAEFRRETGLPLTAARVIGRDPTNWHESVLLDRGERDGVRPDMGVVAPDGVVGRVIRVMPKTAVVLLVSDRNSVVPGLVQRSRDEGLIEGLGDGRLKMKYLSNLADVEAGDLVITSGLTPEFPKGLRIGTVTAVERSPDAISQQVWLAPAINLARLEDVLILPLSGGGR